MRNLLYISKICLMILVLVTLPACTRDNDEVPGDYVDLGLSSGTKWKSVNEKNAADAGDAFSTYEEAKSAFGNKMPSREQWMELFNECYWTWSGMGYNVVGITGKSISLPASGYRDCDGNVSDVGYCGYYWSSSPDGSEKAWILGFDSCGVGLLNDSCCYGLSVRLVQD